MMYHNSLISVSWQALRQGQKPVTLCTASLDTLIPISRTSSLCHVRQNGKQTIQACTRPQALTLQTPPLWRWNGLIKVASVTLLHKVFTRRAQMMFMDLNSENYLDVLE